MSRQTRTLMFLGAVAVAGVVSLGLMAERYQGVLTERVSGTERHDVGRRTSPPQSLSRPPRAEKRAAAPSPTVEQRADHEQREALRYVDAFLLVREALSEAIESGGLSDTGDAQALSTLRDVRRRALADADLDAAEYGKVRKLVELWKRGDPLVTLPFRMALDARRAEIASRDLGRFERSDL